MRLLQSSALLRIEIPISVVPRETLQCEYPVGLMCYEYFNYSELNKLNSSSVNNSNQKPRDFVNSSRSRQF